MTGIIEFRLDIYVLMVTVYCLKRNEFRLDTLMVEILKYNKYKNDHIIMFLVLLHNKWEGVLV